MNTEAKSSLIRFFCYTAQMARYGIATLFEDYPDRHEFTEANTPLHLTHVDVLNIDLEPDKFISRLPLLLF